MPNYNSYYPATYQNPYQGGYGYNQPMQMPQQQPIVPGTQMSFANQPLQAAQNGGFVTVRSEAEARSYPVAPGMSVTFKNESAPYCYTKTMGFSQLEAPKFEKFRLVKEESNETASDPDNEPPKTEYAQKSDVGVLASAIKEIQKNYETLRTDLESTRSDLDYVMTKRQLAKSKKELDGEN